MKVRCTVLVHGPPKQHRLSYMQTLSKTFSAWSTVQAVQKQCNKAPVEENSEQHKQLHDAEVFFGICFL